MWKTFKRKEETKKQKLQAAFSVWSVSDVFWLSLWIFLCVAFCIGKSHKNTTKTVTECNIHKNSCVGMHVLQASHRRRIRCLATLATFFVVFLRWWRLVLLVTLDSSPRLTCCSPVALPVCPRHHSDPRGLCHLYPFMPSVEQHTALQNVLNTVDSFHFHWRKSQGVSLTHGNLLAYVRWHVQYYQLSHEDWRDQVSL